MPVTTPTPGAAATRDPLAPSPAKGIGELQRSVLQLLRNSCDPAATPDLAARLGKSPPNVRSAIKPLVELGEVAQVPGSGTSKANPSQWFIPAIRPDLAQAPTDSRPCDEEVTERNDKTDAFLPPAIPGYLEQTHRKSREGASTQAAPTGLRSIADVIANMGPESDHFREATNMVTNAPSVPATDDDADDARPPEFALWDDGSLSIVLDDDVLRLPPEDTRRLAGLLGVPLELGL